MKKEHKEARKKELQVDNNPQIGFKQRNDKTHVYIYSIEIYVIYTILIYLLYIKIDNYVHSVARKLAQSSLIYTTNLLVINRLNIKYKSEVII